MIRRQAQRLHQAIEQGGCAESWKVTCRRAKVRKVIDASVHDASSLNISQQSSLVLAPPTGPMWVVSGHMPDPYLLDSSRLTIARSGRKAMTSSPAEQGAVEQQGWPRKMLRHSRTSAFAGLRAGSRETQLPRY